MSSDISTVVNSDLERLSGYYALKDNDFGSDDIYLYFNYNNNTANSFISPFYRYSYAIIPPGETGYVGLFNQISRASNYDISDPRRTLVSVWYSVVYLGGYRIRNISDDRPKYTAESLPLSAFLAESGLGADVAEAQAGGKPWNKDSHWLSDDWLSDCMSAGIDVNDQAYIWPDGVGDYLQAFETERKQFQFSNPNGVAMIADDADLGATHQEYSEDDVKDRKIDLFISRKDDLSANFQLSDFTGKKLVYPVYDSYSSQADEDKWVFYLDQLSTFYTGPDTKYMQGFQDVETLVSAHVPIKISPAMRYRPFYSDTVANTTVQVSSDSEGYIVLDNPNDEQASDALLLEDDSVEYRKGADVVYAWMKDGVPFMNPDPRARNVAVDTSFEHDIDIRTAYDLKNNHGVDILSLFTNYHMPTMQTDGLPF